MLHASLTHLLGKDSSDRPVYWSHMKVLILEIPGHSGDFSSHTHLGELVEDVEEDLGLLDRQKLEEFGHLTEGLHPQPRAPRNLV